MKNIIILLLIGFLSIAEAQKIKYGNFSPQLKADLKDTTKSIVADTADVLRSDMSDSLQNFKNLAYSTPQDYADNPDTVGIDFLYDDTEEINLALANGGYVYLPYGKYKINNVLKIKSNTYFDAAPGTEIFLEAAADTYMVMNVSHRDLNSGTPAGLDSNIVIGNIKFIGNAENQGNRANWPGWGGYCLYMDSVKSVTIKDNYFENIKNFAGWISHFQTIRLINNGFNTDKDGIDLIVGNDFVIDGSYGHTGDDMHALGIGAYSIFYQADDGNVEGGIIKNINPYYVDSTKMVANETFGAKSIVYMGGSGAGGAYKFINIIIKDIRGDVDTYPIRIINGTTAAGQYISGTELTHLEDIVIEKINTSTTAYPNVRFKPATAENITIRNISLLDSGNQVSAVEMGDTSTTSIYKDIRLENIHGGENIGNLIAIEDCTDFYGFTIDNVSGKNSAGKWLINITGNTSFYDYFEVRNVVVDSMGLFISSDNILWDCPIVFKSYSVGNFSNPIILKGVDSLKAVFQSGFYNNCTYSVQCNTAASDYRLLGSGIVYKDFNSLVFTLANELSINNRDLIVDTDDLTPQDGDRVFSRDNSSNSTINVVNRYDSDQSKWLQTELDYELYGFSSINPDSTDAGASWDTTLTISGLSITSDYIIVMPPANFNDGFSYSAHITNTNTVHFIITNTSDSNFNHPAFSANLRIMVIKSP